MIIRKGPFGVGEDCVSFINSNTDAIKPSVCLNVILKALRSISIVSIAMAVYLAWPLGPTLYHLPIAASSIHKVKLPRFRKPASYSRQLVTLRFILGMWCLLASLCLLGMGRKSWI
jgi:hypothetical protein